jgi:Holliday junction resolvase RusA-like endonuclease
MVGAIRPTSRPDVDNFLKSAMDAINGIVVADDSVIVSVKAEKKFGLNPKLVPLIEPIAASPSSREAR